MNYFKAARLSYPFYLNSVLWGLLVLISSTDRAKVGILPGQVTRRHTHNSHTHRGNLIQVGLNLIQAHGPIGNWERYCEATALTTKGSVPFFQTIISAR